ncbi:hypothetical protein ACLOJK_025302 [Asimina triloba]
MVGLLNQLLRILGKSGKVERMMKLVDFDPWSIEAMVKGLSVESGSSANYSFAHELTLFFKMVASGVELNIGTYSILLKNLLAAGNWRKYVEVLQWMEDAGIQPSFEMYQNVVPYIRRENCKEKSGRLSPPIPK